MYHQESTSSRLVLPLEPPYRGAVFSLMVRYKGFNGSPSGQKERQQSSKVADAANLYQFGVSGEGVHENANEGDGETEIDNHAYLDALGSGTVGI